MDLSLTHFDRAAELVVWPGDIAVLMIGVAARQGASRTATVQAGFELKGGVTVEVLAMGKVARLFAPIDGAFNGGVAAMMMRWNEEAARWQEE